MINTPYPPYAPWIADLPAGWRVGNVGRMAYLKARVGWQNLRSDEFVDEGPYCVTGTDFRNGRIHWAGCYHVSEARYAIDPYIQLRDGDLLVTKDGTIGKLATVDAMSGPATLNSGVFVVRPINSSFDNRYLYWVLGSGLFTNFVSYMADGTTINHLYQNVFVRFPFPLPPSHCQLAIAKFLDRETAHLDALIEKKRRLLKLLEEKRLAVITHAVTKGLDPNVAMKDSGIDWLGQIPAHWGTKKIKYAVSHVVDCLHTTPHYDGDLLYPAVRTADIDRGQLLLEQVRLVSEEVYLDRIQRLQPQAGDILYSREGERFGMAALVPTGVDLCLGQRMMMFRVQRDFSPAYFMWAMNSEAIYQQVILHTGGATSPHVNIRDIINFPIPFPSLEEQSEIAKHIDHECARLQRISSRIGDAIGSLAEYRSALITNAVTGRIDVRGEIAKEAAA